MDATIIIKSDIEAIIHFVYIWTNENAGCIQVNPEIPDSEFISLLDKIKYKELIVDDDDVIQYTDIYELFSSVNNEMTLNLNLDVLVLKFMFVGDHLKLWTFIDPALHSTYIHIPPYITHFT